MGRSGITLVCMFEATATFRAIIKKIKKDYPDINQ
jgi:hypothetical protein